MRFGQEYIYCIYDGNLVKVPCENWYPKYDKSEIIKEGYTFGDGYGLYFEYENDYNFALVEDDWDGFKIVDIREMDYSEAISIINGFLKEVCIYKKGKGD